VPAFRATFIEKVSVGMTGGILLSLSFSTGTLIVRSDDNDGDWRILEAKLRDTTRKKALKPAK
jgi:hypothetical protein